MLIVIMGNISSGKTTTCKELMKHLKGYKYLCLDDYRRKYNKDRDVSGELLAQQALLTDMFENENIVLEVTGVGKYFYQYIDQYKWGNPGSKIWKFELRCSPIVCKARTDNKFSDKYKWPPLPKEWDSWLGTSNLDIKNKIYRSIDFSQYRIPTPDVVVDSEKLLTGDIVEYIVDKLQLSGVDKGYFSQFDIYKDFMRVAYGK